MSSKFRKRRQRNKPPPQCKKSPPPAGGSIPEENIPSIAGQVIRFYYSWVRTAGPDPFSFSGSIVVRQTFPTRWQVTIQISGLDELFIELIYDSNLKRTKWFADALKNEVSLDFVNEGYFPIQSGQPFALIMRRVHTDQEFSASPAFLELGASL